MPAPGRESGDPQDEARSARAGAGGHPAPQTGSGAAPDDARPAPVVDDTPGPARLRGNFLSFLAGNGLLYAARLVVFMLLAKSATAEAVGQFEKAFAWSAPILLLFGLELRAVLVADPDREFSFHAYRRLQGMGLAIGGAVLLLVGLRDVPLGPAMVTIFLGAAAANLALQAAKLFWGALQKRERIDALLLPNLLRAVAMVLPFAILLPMATASDGPDGSATTRAGSAAVASCVVTFALGWVAIGLWIDRRRGLAALHDDDRRTNARELRRLAAHAFPLAVVGMLVQLGESLPRLVMAERQGGLEALGYFGPLAYVPLGAQFVVVQAGLALSNRLAVSYRRDLTAFRRLTRRLVGAAVLLGVVVFGTLWLLGPWLLSALYWAEYAAYFPAFLVLVAAQCVLLVAAALGYVMTQMRLFWVQVPLQVVVVGVTGVAAVLLIPDVAGETASEAGSGGSALRAGAVAGGAWTMLIRSVAHVVLYGACALTILHRRRLRDVEV